MSRRAWATPRLGGLTDVVRSADPERDAAACAAIYSPFVADCPVSFEDEPPDAAEMATRIEEARRTYGWLVFDRDGRVVGYAYAGPHRSRAAYRWAVDVAVYVDPAHRRGGVARRLYERLFELLRGQGFRIACAGITLPNEASIKLHRALGFEPVGTYRGIGWKAGAWRDVAWWQLELRPRGEEPPAEPLPPRP